MDLSTLGCTFSSGTNLDRGSHHTVGICLYHRYLVPWTELLSKNSCWNYDFQLNVGGLHTRLVGIGNWPLSRGEASFFLQFVIRKTFPDQKWLKKHPKNPPRPKFTRDFSPKKMDVRSSQKIPPTEIPSTGFHFSWQNLTEKRLKNPPSQTASLGEFFQFSAQL